MGELRGKGKGERMNIRRKGKKKRGGGGGGGGGWGVVGEITDHSIKMDLMDIKFRYLDLLNTRNLPVVPDKNFNC